MAVVAVARWPQHQRLRLLFRHLSLRLPPLRLLQALLPELSRELRRLPLLLSRLLHPLAYVIPFSVLNLALIKCLAYGCVGCCDQSAVATWAIAHASKHGAPAGHLRCALRIRWLGSNRCLCCRLCTTTRNVRLNFRSLPLIVMSDFSL